jgi:hypothetical protein
MRSNALVADFGRVPTHAEMLLIESATALAVRARRLRRLGRDKEAADASRLFVRTIGKLGIKPGKKQSPEDRAAAFRQEMLAAATPGGGS